MKICSRCNLEKSKDKFHVNNSLDDKLTHRCKTCTAEIYRDRVDRDPATAKRKQKECDLRGRYNLSLDDYDSMVLNQAGKCGICDKKAKLVIDHCHDTRRVRMLLCAGCNTSLGVIENKPRFDRFMEYINRFK